MKHISLAVALLRYVSITMLVLFVFVLGTWAQNQQIYNVSIGLGSGEGTVNYRMIVNYDTCLVHAKYTYHYTRAGYDSFVYVSSAGQQIPIPEVGYFYSISGSPGAGVYAPCPANGVFGRPMTLLEKNYQIYVYPKTGSCGLYCVNAAYVPGTFGYINPKYVVAGVLYSPPGSRSTAVYTNSTMVSNTSSIMQSFTSSTTVSTSTQVLSGVPTPTGVFAWLNGTETQTSSNTETQVAQNNLTVTATLNTSSGTTIPGPATDYIGLNHDYDIIKVWINPVLLFTVYNTTMPGETAVGWWGYGSSALDTTAPIDIWPIPVGCLNGDFPQTDSACASPLSAFQRPWAANENWPAGQGPGLTQTDLDNILAADPWGTCHPNLPVGSTACPTYSAGFLFPNFSLSDQTQLTYIQPLPGGLPSSNSYQVSTTNSQTQGSTTASTYSQTWGYEFDQVGTGFLSAFSSKLSFSQTLTWSYSYTTTALIANTMTGTANIVGPACAGNPCNPSYPPSPNTFGNVTAFDIFIDARFGTFAFLPAAY